jgi:UDP-N-acetylmuramoyl-L-alanyl-D-glutamate--2,6-diaminopimelate ligase
METLKRILEAVLPRPLYRALGAPYHFLLSFISALRYGFPARKLTVIGVTGTKGKSSVTEMVAAIFESAGHRVALSSTIHFRIAGDEVPNRYKMTLPGRGFIQKFLHDAVSKKCDVAVIEITSESVLQYRHLFLSLDALVFTNLAKEHLESHGGMENYFNAKMQIGRELARSSKRPRAIIANQDDEYGRRFLTLPVEKTIPFSLSDVSEVTPTPSGISFSVEGIPVALPQPGTFSVLNALSALYTARFFGIELKNGVQALESLTLIQGRAERIDCGQGFTAIVDYAHTPDSLSALYGAFSGRKICVLGNTGGGRDTWKRPEMGRIAEEACAEVILTNEDPYDEDPQKIVDEMASGMKRAPRIIMDRREAIKEALKRAQEGDTVLITGKGTDPYIMLAGGTKLPWSDAQVVREELQKLLAGSQ